MVRYFILVLVGAVCLLTACSDSSDKVLRDDPPPPSGPPIETEPTFTPDRRYIYYVHTDTAYPANNGIYMVSTANPVPYEVLKHGDAGSPCANINRSKVAFLDSTGLVYYDVASRQFTESSISTTFSHVFFVNDTKLIGSSGGSIYLIDMVADTASFYRTGFGASPHELNSFLYVTGGTLVQANVSTGADTTLLNTSIPGPIAQVSHFPGSGRYVFVSGAGSYDIRTYTSPGGSLVYITSTNYFSGLLTGYDEIVYTGTDGELWRCDFDGGNVREYRGTDSP